MIAADAFNQEKISSWHKSSVIWEKGESQNGCYKKRKHTIFSEKQTLVTPWYAHVRVCIREKKILVFREILCALVFCNTRFEICPFALLSMKFALFLKK